MKRVLSLALVLCLILSALLSFSSCGTKVSAKDVEKNPQKVLSDALSNTGRKYFNDNADAEKLIEKAKKLGSISISFESEELLGEGKIKETVYMDSENGKYVSDTDVSIMGMDLAARIFLDSKGIAISGESIFGSDLTLLFDLATIAEDFPDCALAEMMGFGSAGGEKEDFTQAINVLKDGWAKAFAKPGKDTLDFINECYRLLEQKVTTEQVEISEDKSVKCVVVTYTLDEDTIEAYYERVIEEYLDGETELKDAIKENFEDMLAGLDIDLTYQLCISQKTKEVVKLSLGGTLEADGDEIALDMVAVFEADEIRIDATVDGLPDSQTVEAGIVITREEKDGTVTYSMSADGKMGSVSVDLFNATYTYVKESGDITIALDVFNEENERTELELKGNLKVTDKACTLTFTSLTVEDETINFVLTVAYEVLDQIPALPADAKDITDISAEDWGEIMTDFQSSTLGQLIFGMAPQE